MHLQSDREAPSAVTVITGGRFASSATGHWPTSCAVFRGSALLTTEITPIWGPGVCLSGGFNDQILCSSMVRVNDNVYESAQIGTEFPLDIDLIERIEIVRGRVLLVWASAFLASHQRDYKRRFKVLPESSFPDQRVALALMLALHVAGTYHGVEGMFSGSIHDRGRARLFFPAFNSPATNYGVAQDAIGILRRASSLCFISELDSRRSGVDSKEGYPHASFAQVFNDNRSQNHRFDRPSRLQYERAILLGAELTATVYFDRPFTTEFTSTAGIRPAYRRSQRRRVAWRSTRLPTPG